MKTTEKRKHTYTSPQTAIVKIGATVMLSISGWAPDSDDSEFGAPTQQQKKWGDLWEKNK